MAGQLILGLSLLVGVHEFGHFAFAKLFGIRVLKFYIFFDFLFPLSNRGKFALFKFKAGETEYGIGWFPLGGYVQIHGMVDETQNGAALAGPPQPDEFRSRPAWQRVLVMLGGILVNVFVGVLIFAVLARANGARYVPAQELRGGVLTSALGRAVGLRNGDRVVGLNGEPLTAFEQLYDPEVLARPGTYFTVERASRRLDLPALPQWFFRRLAAATDTPYVAPRRPFVVSLVVPGDSAARAGLRAGDYVRRVNDQPIAYFDELAAALDANRGRRIRLEVSRGGALVGLDAGVGPNGRLGFAANYLLPTRTRRFSAAESLPEGARQAATVLRVQALGMRKLLQNEVSASASMAGPVEIAQQFGGHWDWPHFWELTATLSLVLAFMNLLPVPGLDGGHLAFLVYEVVARRKPALWFLQGAQRLGALMLLSLMTYVLVVKQIMKLF